jgi:REP element-mobilizing transposase RayT
MPGTGTGPVPTEACRLCAKPVPGTSVSRAGGYGRQMPRPPRIQAPGATYHVTTRGNRRHEIFIDARDRLRFLQLLEQVVEVFGWRCHAYCLMTNHYHLLVQTSGADISQGMHRLNGVYAKWFNWRHGYEGHLFERRFHGELVEGHVHLLELTRYIVLNPVRAGITGTASEWRWSSYDATLGKRPRPGFLTTGWVLSLFNRDLNRARELYADFVAAGALPYRRSRRVPVPGTGTRPDQPYPYTPGNRSASRLTSSAVGRPTTFR